MAKLFHFMSIRYFDKFYIIWAILIQQYFTTILILIQQYFTTIFYIITSYMKCCECWRYGLTWIHYFVALKESKSSATIFLRDNLWIVILWIHNFIFTTHSHSKIMTKLWKNLWYLIYSFKEDEVVGSTISILIRGGSVNLLNLFSLTFSKPAQCIVKCPLYPLSIARFDSWELLVFLNFEAALTFLTWLRLYLITTASKLAYISFSVHSCTKEDQDPHIKIENNFWSNERHCDCGNRAMRSHNQ